MKSALIITGNIRTFTNTFAYFERIIEKYNCDIFIGVSNMQLDLHEYTKASLNMSTDNEVTFDMIRQTLSICKNMNQNIKNIFFVEKQIEDEEFTNIISNQVDKSKSWLGGDILKANLKRKQNIDIMKEYEKINNLKYDYIIQTRFDVMLDLDSFPTYPLENNTFYACNINNDIIHVSNCSENFDVLYNEIIEHFFRNKGNCSSIHSIIENILENNHFKMTSSIVANLDRNFTDQFDTKVTLVTCFYNINRDKWSSHGRPLEKYFVNAEKNVLSKSNPIFIFTTQEYVERCKQIRKNIDKYLLFTKIIVIPFEDLQYYDKLETIREIQQNNLSNIPMGDRDCPEFCIPEYIVVINNKTSFLNQTAEINPFNSQIFQWIDFGLHDNMFMNDSEFFSKKYFSNIYYKKNKIRIVSFHKPELILNKITYYNSHTSTVAATLIGGDKYAVNQLYRMCKQEFNFLLSNRIMNQEQYIYFFLMCEYPELFDFSIAPDWDHLCYTYHKNTTKIAICMSGHMRTFNSCYHNIKTNIIDTLEKNGCETNVFLSTWKDNVCDVQIDNLFTHKHVETTDVNLFNKFKTTQFSRFPGLCGDGTSSNAASMWYKINDAFEMMETHAKENNKKYDIIIRLRPDIIYEFPVDINNIQQCLLTDSLFMPHFHGKYQNVTKTMMDHFFFGSYSVMKTIMKTYESIYIYLLENEPHTAEGYLWSQICSNKINVKRFTCFYSCIRKTNIKEYVYN
jgi:hypothetical protein